VAVILGSHERIKNAWCGETSTTSTRKGFRKGARPSPEKNEFSLEMTCFAEFRAVL